MNVTLGTWDPRTLENISRGRVARVAVSMARLTTWGYVLPRGVRTKEKRGAQELSVQRVSLG